MPNAVDPQAPTATTFSLRELIVDGRLGGAAVGMNKDEVRAAIGPPDDWSSESGVEHAQIWRYGNFELHFDTGRRCWLLFNDYVQEGLNAGQGRRLDRWLFDESFEHDALAARLRASGLQVDEGVERGTHRIRVGEATLWFDDRGLSVIDVVRK